MKKIIAIVILLGIGFHQNAKADEGMWIPSLISELVYMEMQQMGLELTPEEIYSVNQSSLKDAIVIFGRGCTGEIISPEGLLLTNHHCGYGYIQGVSTPENNLLKNGFWANEKNDEIPIEGATVTFLKKIEPATERVMEGVTYDMTMADRDNAIKENIAKLRKEVSEDNDYRVRIASFYGGNEYYIYYYEVFNDVRFVGAPPEAIGKYGADTDNWMWPRHTGDFSLFRVYTAPDGSPAPYSENNVPLKPQHYLPVNISGVKEGDFSMIMGYPGSTDRYLSSWGVELAIKKNNPTIVDIRQNKLDIMIKYMEMDSVIRLKYASKYARTSNYWKYFIGQTKGLKNLKVYDKKKKLEGDFAEWVKQEPEREQIYGGALKDIEKAYDTIAKYNLPENYFYEAVYRGPEILSFANGFKGLLEELTEKEVDEESLQKTIQRLAENTNEHFKDYSKAIDEELLARMLQMFYENVPKEMQPEFLIKEGDKNDGDFSKYSKKLFKKSMFADEASVMQFLADPKAKDIEKDPAYEVFMAFRDIYSDIRKQSRDAIELLNQGKRLFIAGLREMNPDMNYYPDANFTMRLSYGIVDDYYPRDAVHYNYFTTLEGVMEKEDPASYEFTVPKKLKKLYNEKDYGRYGEGDVMKVCFLTNHDITGGNSGSPVINGKGELIGLAFDGNWEAMSGDIAFEPELQRTINVDIRYVLFIIDKFGGAKNLIDEMTIVVDKPKKKIGPPVKTKAVPAEEVPVE
ncbi:MAG: S46 family peptidase [Bacteroidales bacterium]|nr:S46 family peptidase [Bacteroidales bacterium]MCF8343169.1 S46 family peptidase [Bacteroidales bacterium]MCF8350662.1 S46 family peptidase [Bacteroidales bacterium]MCF8376828.1 S46 family peptidase [Bacteroidales bacterium]MCF8400735.1 S46 family peptidase [Bacteroidales bacterium]